MQSARRSNSDRTAATRAALVEAARALFIEKSYAGTGTPEIVAAAGVTRGALYHHFADKRALFQAVVEQEARAVAEEIDRATPGALPVRKALIKGADAYLAAMALPGRTRLLLLDGAAVLGPAEMEAIDRRHANRTLREGLQQAMQAGVLRKLPLDALTTLLSAAFDRAALAIDAGAPLKDYRTAIVGLIDGLMVKAD